MKAYELDKILKNAFGPGESWDHDGIMVDCGGDIKRVYVALDATGEAIDKAISVNADAIITHHPLIFHPLESVSVSDSVGKRVIKAIKNNISVLSYHTRLDIVSGGVNDCLCEKAGLVNVEVYSPYTRIGETKSPVDFCDFARACEKSLETKAQNIVDCGRKVKKVFVMSGSGKEGVKYAYESGCDTFLTGELSHDTLVDCREYGINALCLTHYATENIVLPFLRDVLRKNGIEAF